MRVASLLCSEQVRIATCKFLRNHFDSAESVFLGLFSVDIPLSILFEKIVAFIFCHVDSILTLI